MSAEWNVAHANKNARWRMEWNGIVKSKRNIHIYITLMHVIEMPKGTCTSKRAHDGETKCNFTCNISQLLATQTALLSPFVRFTFWYNYSFCVCLFMCGRHLKGIAQTKKCTHEREKDRKTHSHSHTANECFPKMKTISFKCYIFSEKNDCFIAYVATAISMLCKVNWWIYIYCAHIRCLQHCFKIHYSAMKWTF